MFFIGFDVGGTKIEASLFKASLDNFNNIAFEYVNNKNEIIYAKLLANERILTERQNGYDQILNKMKNLVLNLCNQALINIDELYGIGIGVPGSVDFLSQSMIKGSIFALFNKPLCQDLKQALNLNPHFPIYMDNDANCFALAEVLCGAGIDYYKKTTKHPKNHLAIGIILGTGCGAGIVVNAKALSGLNGGAGEIGHSTLYPNGIPCYCGRNGCAEQYVSGSALEALFNSRRYSQIKNYPNAREIFDLAINHEPVAIATVKQHQKNVALLLGKLNSIINPDYFVLGGGLSMQPALFNGLAELTQEQSFLSDCPVNIYRYVLGDSAGVIGATMLLSLADVNV